MGKYKPSPLFIPLVFILSVCMIGLFIFLINPKIGNYLEIIVTNCVTEGKMFNAMTNRSCCTGLTRKLSGSFNSKAGCVYQMSVLVCIRCGDGICGEEENLCVCPEDCAR